MWNISIEGSKEVYVRHNDEFVARFKYSSPKASAKHFVKFLEKNYTPEEYFAKRKLGIPPLSILQQKGYVSYMEGSWNKNIPESNPYQESDKEFHAWKDGNFQAMLDVQDGEE